MKISILVILVGLVMLLVVNSQRVFRIFGLLLFCTILVILLTIIIRGSWFGLTLFLVYITGILVLFRYFIAIRSNSTGTAKKFFKFFLVSRIMFIFGGLVKVNVISLPLSKINFESSVIELISYLNISLY